MFEELENTRDDETKNEPNDVKAKKKSTIRKALLVGGVVLLVGLGIVWKCWDGKKFNIHKLSDDELGQLREKLQGVLLSPNSDQEAKLECINWINVIDKIVQARNPVDRKSYVYPKGGDHGTNLWKPD